MQPAELADGWGQVLHDQSVGLTFRLAQQVDPARQREALEELAVSRDPSDLDRLFAWQARPPQPLPGFDAAAVLQAIGDRNGDVYDRALRLREATPSGSEANGFLPFRLAEIMARVDPDRALAYFKKNRQYAALDFVGNERALDLASTLFQQQNTVEEAISVFRGMLDPGMQSFQPSFSEDRLVQLREYAAPLLTAAYALPTLTDGQRTQMRFAFGDIIGQPPAIDPAQADAQLLSRRKGTYDPVPWNPQRQKPDGEYETRPTYTLLQHLQAASDPRVIPHLVKILRLYPESWDDAAFPSALRHYAILCPHAMKREMKLQGVDAGFAERSGLTRYGFYHELLARLSTPRAEQDLYQLDNVYDGPGGPHAWAGRVPLPTSLLNQIVLSLDEGIRSEYGPDTDRLALLLQVAPVRGKPLLDRSLARAGDYPRRTRAGIFALGIRYGHRPLPEALIATYHLSPDEERRYAQAVAEEQRTRVYRGDTQKMRADPQALLLSGDPTAYAEYLRQLDGNRRLVYASFGNFTNEQSLDTTYTTMLDALFPNHPADYVAHVLTLLQSPLLPEREAGRESLERTLFWGFGVDSQALAADRAAQIARATPRLEALSRTSSLAAARALVLAAHGITLHGRDGRGWLPVLARAALSLHPAVARNALALIEQITGATGLREKVAVLPPAQREAALAAFGLDFQEEIRP